MNFSSLELVIAAIDAPSADIRAELKEQLAEEAAQKAAAEQPKLPGSARAGSSPVNGFATNGGLVLCFALRACTSYMQLHCAQHHGNHDDEYGPCVAQMWR